MAAVVPDPSGRDNICKALTQSAGEQGKAKTKSKGNDGKSELILQLKEAVCLCSWEQGRSQREFP